MTTAAAVGVSILRPLCGIDPNLEDNLVANFLIDYDGGPFEVLLCVADANDPSIAVARRVMERFPDVDARLVVGMRERADRVSAYAMSHRLLLPTSSELHGWSKPEN